MIRVVGTLITRQWRVQCQGRSYERHFLLSGMAARYEKSSRTPPLCGRRGLYLRL